MYILPNAEHVDEFFSLLSSCSHLEFGRKKIVRVFNIIEIFYKKISRFGMMAPEQHSNVRLCAFVHEI